jgi:hypothetical protein
MRPLESEVGIILEPADIEVANKVRAFLKEYYEGDKPAEDRSPYFMAPLQSSDQSDLELDISQACNLIQQAHAASRNLRHKYRSRDKVLRDLVEEGASDTYLYKSLEADLPEFADKIRIFGSLATAAQCHVEVSQLEYMFKLPAIQSPTSSV